MSSRHLVSVMFLRNLCLLVVLFRGTVCYPSGAPVQACNDMMPQHGSAASNDKGTLDLTAAMDGKRNVKVVLTGTFKGFLIKAVSKDGGVVSGKFTIDKPDTMKGLDCDGHTDSAVTHTHNGDKNSVAVTWTAPDSFTGDVMFRATAVRTKPDFYVGLMSSAIKIEAPSPSDSDKGDKDKKTEKSGGNATLLTGIAVSPLAVALIGVALNAQRHRLTFH
ncbi:putative defense protein isoform X1 [Rhipicephalus microplus]|uniref:putative defense protein isoform X1 n=2 Tax=Rhipicephalus microplus TaxID=6941 RepID=UPI003F6C1B88